MADHTVTLNYSKNGFSASPSKIEVRPGQTIHFQLGDAPPDGEMLITFKHPQFFSAGKFHSGDADIRVTGKPIPTTYQCQLLVGGQVIAESKETGGDIVPVGTT